MNDLKTGFQMNKPKLFRLSKSVGGAELYKKAIIFYVFGFQLVIVDLIRRYSCYIQCIILSVGELEGLTSPTATYLL